MKCSYCSRELDETAKFCTYCGSVIQETARRTDAKPGWPVVRLEQDREEAEPQPAALIEVASFRTVNYGPRGYTAQPGRRRRDGEFSHGE